MAFVKAPRVKVESSTTGTGAYTIGSTVAGFQGFSAIGDTNTADCVVTDGTDWEEGRYTYTASGTTLARTTIYSSTNGGAAVNWGAGTKTIMGVYAAGKAVTLDGTETLTNKSLTAVVLGTPASGTLTNCTGLPLAGVLSIGKGTSFPGSPTSGDQFFRTDLGLDCYYDGTRWLTKNEYVLTIPITDTFQPFSATTGNMQAVVDQARDIWVMRVAVTTYVVTTNNGTNYWSLQFVSRHGAPTVTNVGSAVTTASDAANTQTAHQITIGAAMLSAETVVGITATKVLSPGNLYLWAAMVYRLIVT